ncbi:MAG: hypothetical protein B1H05_00225 [Candidatus Cloacimonas sp. 4484_140]|nr:MAG: hypothetical protein B1H05_00225 [Candidatus Cloacimonas sp. 4484_140]
MPTMFIWLGFFFSLAMMILIARKNLWLGFIIGALILGFINLKPVFIFQQIKGTILDPAILLLGIAVGIIPLIGGVLEESGLMVGLFKNLRLKRKLFLIFGPAFLGMLPMPGGALLSAPLVLRAGGDISDKQYVAINVWFRHALILIYPLGALLVTSKMAGLYLYRTLMYLIPGFILMILLGWIFLLKGIAGNLPSQKHLDYKALFTPILIIIAAPLTHLLLMTLFPNILTEIPLIIGVSVSLVLAMLFGKMKPFDLIAVIKKMKPLKYFLIIIGMFLFLNIFKASNISAIIAEIAISKSFTIVVIAAFLGFVTGRVQMPFAIALPIFYSRFGADSMSYLLFAVMFFSTYMGYIVSPIHPCVSVSIEFFGSNLKGFYKKLFWPVSISLAIVYIIAVIFI